MDDCVRNFVRFFKDHPPTFAKDLNSKSMTIGGKRVSYDNFDTLSKIFTADKVLEYDLAPWWKMDVASRMDWFINFVEGTFRQELVEKKKAQRALKERLAGKDADLKLPDADYILNNLQPFRVLGDRRKEGGVQFLNTTDRVVTDYDYYAIDAALKAAEIDKDVIARYLTSALHVREIYDPHSPVSIKPTDDESNVYEINRYVTPTWRLAEHKPVLPEEVEQLMRHLFPKETCREFVYTWIYHSLTARCGTYLYLCGGQGSGKNTLAGLIAALHGASNTSNPKQDSLTGRFNHYLKFKRFIFFDEFNCRVRRDKDILKLIINDRVQIEGKGRDHEDIDIHASYFLANNSLEAIGLDPVDRRFSVPEVNHDSLIPVFGREWIERLQDKIKLDAEWLAGFGWWVLENFKNPKWSREEPYQTTRFEEIVLATARLGLGDMIARTLKKEQNSYDYYDEREAFKRTHKGQHYPPIQDWTKFFQTVKVGGEPLGRVEGKLFIPREDLQRAPGEELIS
jgi:hypothetical protein